MVTTDEVTTEVQEDNAELDAQTTLPETVTESVPVETTEAEPVEPPDIQALLSTTDDAALAEIPAVKSLLARREESQRQITEAEVTKQRRLADQEWLATGSFTTELQDAVSITGEGEDRQLSFDAEGLQTASKRAIISARDLVHEEYAAVLARRIGDAGSVSAARLEQLTGLAAQVALDKATPVEFLDAQLDTLRDVERDTMKAELRDELRAEWEQEQAAGAEVKTRRENTTDRAEQDGATRGISGEQGSYYSTRAEIDSAFIDGKITGEQYRTEREKPSYQAMPEY